MSIDAGALPTEPRPAATVVLLRDHAAGPQVYLLRRPRGNAFTAGAHVFVGGRVDPQDSDGAIVPLCEGFNAADAARILGLADPLQAWSLYIAALRETFEESAVLLGRPRGAVLPSGVWTAAREQLNGGHCGFAEVLGRLDFLLQPGQLRYLAHWVTPPQERRRFDTRFFLCRVPPGQQPEVDGSEATEARWMGVDEVVRAQREERIKLAPPTTCVLEDLAGAEDAAQMFDRAPNRPIMPIHPRLVGDFDNLTVLLPGDAEYDRTEPAGNQHRVVRVGNHWELRRG